MSFARLAPLCVLSSLLLAADEASNGTAPPETIVNPAPKAAPPLVREKPEEDELVTDRPDFTESANTIRPNWYQLETGFGVDWENGRTGKSRNVTLPFPLMRIGLTERLELRVSSDGYGRSRFRDEQGQSLSHGMNDFQLGMKYLVAKEREWLPQLAVIAFINEPFGSKAFTSGTVDTTVKICWGKELPKGFEASGNINLSSLQEDGQRFVEKDVTLSVGHELAWGFKGYVEAYRMMTVTFDRENLNVFQTGWARQLGNRWQFDMSVARTFAGSTPQWSIMGGVTFKAPFFGYARSLRN